MNMTRSHGVTSRPAPVNALPVGARLQEFEIRSVIGGGGFGIVYHAWDTSLGREVAIKEYLPVSHATRRADGRVVTSSEHQREIFEKGRHYFVSEARMLARFKHPALVEVLRFWEAQGTAYMVMPYYPGQSLHERIQAGFRLMDNARLEAFLLPLLDGLAHLHREHCYHRDISSDNILMRENDQPLLLDFGAARRILVDQSEASTVILKPGFAPIEQYSDDHTIAPQGPWTDLYALSAVTYQAITGTMPTVSVARIIRDPLKPLAQSVLPEFSPAVLGAIDAGLRVQPDERPQSVQAFLELMRTHPTKPPALPESSRSPESWLPEPLELSESLKPPKPSKPSGVPESSEPSTLPKPPPRRRWLWIGVPVFVLAVFAGLWGLLSDRNNGQEPERVTIPALTGQHATPSDPPPPTDISHVTAGGTDADVSSDGVATSSLADTPVVNDHDADTDEQGSTLDADIEVVESEEDEPLVIEPPKGALFVDARPWGHLYVNGTRVHQTPPPFRIRQINPGRVNIAVCNDTHRVMNFTLHIEAGYAYEIEYNRMRASHRTSAVKRDLDSGHTEPARLENYWDELEKTELCQ